MAKSIPFTKFYPYQAAVGRGGRISGGGRGNGGRYSYTPQGRDCGRFGRGGAQQCNAPSSYCWMHGYGGHTSQECQNPAPGHCHQATLNNKMGGSTYKCSNARAERAARNLSPAPFQRLSPSTQFVPNYQNNYGFAQGIQNQVPRSDAWWLSTDMKRRVQM